MFDIFSKILIHSTFPTVQLDKLITPTHFTFHISLHCTLSHWYAIDEREGVAGVLLHGRHTGRRR
jgi:hypothetical protein